MSNHSHPLHHCPPPCLIDSFILCLMLLARALALAPTAAPKAKPSPTLATATATATPAAAAVVEGHFPRLGAEEVTQSMRARLGLARGPKVALGRLSATLCLRTRKVGKGKGKANQGSGHGRKYKDHKNNVQTRKDDKQKVIFCLQIVSDIPLFT